MRFPEYLLIFSLLPLLYIARKSKKERSRSARVKKLGVIFEESQIPYFYIAGAMGILMGVFAWFTRGFMTDQAFSIMNDIGHVELIRYSTWDPLKYSNIPLILISQLFYASIGEEFFFRGYVGGKLFRRYGFTKGNLMQAGIFILPFIYYHFKAPTMHIYAYIPLMFVLALLCGWLRYKSKSIFPGMIVHAITTGVIAYTLML